MGFGILEKTPRLEISGMTELARGEECTFQIPGVCNRDRSTSVFCHSNMSRHGRGMRRKSDDCYGAIGCSACHYWYDYGKDATRAEKEEVFVRAMERTWLRLWSIGKFRIRDDGKLARFRMAASMAIHALGSLNPNQVIDLTSLRKARADLEKILKEPT